MVDTDKEASRRRLLESLTRQIFPSVSVTADNQKKRTRTAAPLIQYQQQQQRPVSTSEAIAQLLHLAMGRKQQQRPVQRTAPLALRQNYIVGQRKEADEQTRRLWLARNPAAQLIRWQKSDLSSPAAIDRRIVQLVDQHNNALLGARRDIVDRLYIDRFSFDPRSQTALQRMRAAQMELLAKGGRN